VSGDPSRDYAASLARVDPRWDAAHTERALAGLHRRRTRRRAGAVLGACLVLFTGSAVGAWVNRDQDGGVAATESVPTRVPASDRVVRLADGSRVMPEDGAQVVVAHVTDELIAVRVDQGAAEIEVVPGLPRRFEVSVGAVTVRVIGTAFRVERLAEGRVYVSVQRGHVDVVWADGHAELFAGDEGTFPLALEPATEPVATEPVATEPVTELAALEPLVTEPPATERAPVAADLPTAEARGASAGGEPSGWRDLARASRYDEAYTALDATDRSREVTDEVDDLLLAADVARLSGHAREALPWLEAVQRDHASDPRAVLASFTRGRILMEIGRPLEAARQLEGVLAMEPGGSLAEDALARAALAHEAAGNHERAVELAERYVASYPGGRWSRRLSATGVIIR